MTGFLTDVLKEYMRAFGLVYSETIRFCTHDKEARVEEVSKSKPAHLQAVIVGHTMERDDSFDIDPMVEIELSPGRRSEV